MKGMERRTEEKYKEREGGGVRDKIMELERLCCD
jgi:hypothetical protein